MPEESDTCLNREKKDSMPTLWEKVIPLKTFQTKNPQPTRAALLTLLAGLPETPGVYFFLDEEKKLLYIGKATSLRDRVKSYFSHDIAETRGPKIVLMLEKVCFVAYQKTDSVLEALILESKLIKEHQPHYNTDEKDDKSYNHVVITKETFPRVLVVRGRDIAQGKFVEPTKYLFGPFPSGSGLREAMKIVRKLFPFRDTCTPYVERLQKKETGPIRNVSQAKRSDSGRACFSAQIGLCPGVCTGTVTASEYGRMINHIRLFFEGRKSVLVKQLTSEMRAAAKALEFERAGEIKRTLFGLQHIQDMALIKEDVRERSHAVEGIRMEAYDVAHLGGGSSVGVMVVMKNGRPEKQSYKKFILRGEHGGNDVSALEEIMRRRLKHPEWGSPDIIIVDGSFLQLGVAEKLFAETETVQPLLVGVVKDTRHQPKDIINLPPGFANVRADILLANNEAHRFAITFHRKRRGKEFLGRSPKTK